MDVAITDFNVTKNGENLGYTEFVDSISLITSVPDVENPEPVDVFVISYKATMKASVDAKFLIGYSCNNDDVTTGMTIGGEESIASGVWNTFDVTEGQIREDSYYVVLTVTIDVSKVQFANIVVDLENMITQVDNPVWDGSIPASKPDTLVVDTQKKLISVNDVQAFAYLNTLVNDPDFYDKYGSKWQYTVELNTDVNLNGLDWTPMTLSNFVAFEGNNHTISNLKVDVDSDCAGLFGTVSCNDRGVTYVRNLNIVGADVSGNHKVGVVVGSSPQGAIENVKVYDFSVTGVKYVGGIFGGGNGSANGCTVEKGTVTIPADGLKEAGGLIGYLSNDGKVSDVHKVISGNKVKDVVIKAPTVASGLVSQPNSSNTGSARIVIEDNKLENVSVYTYKDSSAALYVSYNVNGKSVVRNNTAAGCEAGVEVYGLKLVPTGDSSIHGIITVYDGDGLKNLGKLNDEWVALFTDGNGSDYSNYLNKDYYYGWTWGIVLESDVDLDNETIDPIKVGKRSYFDGQGHTIRNAVIVTDPTTENEAGLFMASSCAMRNLVLDNINVTGSNVGNSTAGVLSGSCNSAVQNITIKNSSVTNGKYTGGVVGYGYTDVSNCDLEKVTVKGGYKIGGLIGYICSSGNGSGDVKGNSLTDCDVNGIGGGVYAGGKSEYIIGRLVGNYNTDGVCTGNAVVDMDTAADGDIGKVEDGKTVTVSSPKGPITNVEQLKDVLTGAGAAGAGNTLITLNNDLDLAGVVWTPIKVDGYHGADVVTFDGNGHTITGLTAPLFAGGFAGGSGIVITNLTIADSNIISTHTEGSGAFIEYVDSMDTITLINCHLIDSSVTGSRTGGLIGYTTGYNNTNDGAVKTYVTIKGCSVVGCNITGSSVGGINGHAGANPWTYTTIENCTVIDSTLNSTKDDTWRVGVVVGTANVGEVTIKNITESGNTLTQTSKTAPGGQSNLYGRFVPGSTGKLVIDGVNITNPTTA